MLFDTSYSSTAKHLINDKWRSCYTHTPMNTTSRPSRSKSRWRRSRIPRHHLGTHLPMLRPSGGANCPQLEAVVGTAWKQSHSRSLQSKSPLLTKMALHLICVGTVERKETLPRRVHRSASIAARGSFGRSRTCVPPSTNAILSIFVCLLQLLVVVRRRGRRHHAGIDYGKSFRG
jgi:hypothetical protein